MTESTPTNPPKPSAEGGQKTICCLSSEEFQRLEPDRLRQELENIGADSFEVYRGVWEPLGNGKTIRTGDLLQTFSDVEAFIQWLRPEQTEPHETAFVIKMQLPSADEPEQASEPADYTTNIREMSKWSDESIESLGFSRRFGEKAVELARNLAKAELDTEERFLTADELLRRYRRRDELRERFLKEYPGCAKRIGLNATSCLVQESGNAPSEENHKSDADGAHTSERTHARESFVRAILEQKGWSVNDWAKKSGVDFNTANSYLKSNRNPYMSTRKKLADALGVSMDKLPL